MYDLEGKKPSQTTLLAWQNKFGLKSILFAILKDLNVSQLKLKTTIEFADRQVDKKIFKNDLIKISNQLEEISRQLTLINQLVKKSAPDQKTVKLQAIVGQVNSSQNNIIINAKNSSLNKLVVLDKDLFSEVLISFLNCYYKKLNVLISARTIKSQLVLRIIKKNKSAFYQELDTVIKQYYKSPRPQLAQLDQIVIFLCLEILLNTGCKLKLSRNRKELIIVMPLSKQLNVFSNK